MSHRSISMKQSPASDSSISALLCWMPPVEWKVPHVIRHEVRHRLGVARLIGLVESCLSRHHLVFSAVASLRRCLSDQDRRNGYSK